MRLADVTTKGVGTGGGTYKIRSYEAITKGPVNGLYDQLDIDPSTLPDLRCSLLIFPCNGQHENHEEARYPFWRPAY